MATAAYIPVEVYLHTVYEPDVDYVCGELEERFVGQDSHSAWQDAIAAWFRAHAGEWRVRPRPEMRVQVSPGNFRVADVAILSSDLPHEPIATHPPVAVFEVLSPEDSHKRLLRKLDDYAQMGIPAVYSLDPDAGIFSKFEDGQLFRRERFELPERGISFAFEEIAKLVL